MRGPETGFSGFFREKGMPETSTGFQLKSLLQHWEMVAMHRRWEPSTQAASQSPKSDKRADRATSHHATPLANATLKNEKKKNTCRHTMKIEKPRHGGSPPLVAVLPRRTPHRRPNRRQSSARLAPCRPVVLNSQASVRVAAAEAGACACALHLPLLLAPAASE